jgi:ornithine--oxo-acid transaminase
VEPDIAILAKALSGGLIPCSAVLMSDRVYAAVYDSLKRSIVHTSTFSENSMSMRAGLATLNVLERENRLREQLAGYEMVSDIRGMGMMSATEANAPALRAASREP